MAVPYCTYNRIHDPCTDEEIFYPKEYASYQQFLLKVVDDAVLKRLDLLTDLKLHLDEWDINTQQKYLRKLEQTEMCIRCYNTSYATEKIPIFPFDYDRTKISSNHYAQILRYLQHRETDPNEIEALSQLLEQGNSFHSDCFVDLTKLYKQHSNTLDTEQQSMQKYMGKLGACKKGIDDDVIYIDALEKEVFYSTKFESYQESRLAMITNVIFDQLQLLIELKENPDAWSEETKIKFQKNSILMGSYMMSFGKHSLPLFDENDVDDKYITTGHYKRIIKFLQTRPPFQDKDSQKGLKILLDRYSDHNECFLDLNRLFGKRSEDFRNVKAVKK